jgi:hypothetical protein
MQQSFRDTKNKAHTFVKNYQYAVKENAEAQSFLNDFFDIFGVDRRRVAVFENPIKTGSKGVKRSDLFWSEVLLVEMKSAGENLDKAYIQAFNYLKGLKDRELPNYIMVCDFKNFHLYDLDSKENYAFKLDDLVNNLHLFDFMNGGKVEDINEFELNQKAAELLGKLHDYLSENGYQNHDLQIFMVRILFCLFAEDTGVFNHHQFTKYLMNFTDENGIDTDMHLQKIFQIFNQDINNRSKNLPDELNDFPYVNGGLFAQTIAMPSFDKSMRDVLIECCHFDWKDISPAIFGSLFQSIMNKKTRRNLGAHYTSEQNILKLIEPLFLDNLKSQFKAIKKLKQNNQRNKKMLELTEYIHSLKFLDPACGCGNFLIVTYRELRKLELLLLQAQQKNTKQTNVNIEIEPRIKLNNFYGIEIDEWPARIAEVAMWLTQHQMNVEFAKAFGIEPDLLPLTQHANIHHTNALAVDWGEVIAKKELNYIIGNPPFKGKGNSPEQNKNQEFIFNPEIKKWKSLDFVSSWFFKSAKFTQNTNIETALIATNSITMGEQVGTLWKPMLEMGVKINFAHRSFSWSNEAKGNATVHCVIIGFGYQNKVDKYIFNYENLKAKPNKIKVDNINPYLIDVPDIVVTGRIKPLFESAKMIYGSKPVEGGFLFLNTDEKEQLLKNNPELKKWIKPVLGAREFLNNKKRYCLWLVDVSTHELRELMKITEIKRRIEGVKQMRLNSPDKGANKLAEIPWKFRDTRVPNTYILVPKVSSSRREYVPMGFFDKNTIVTDLNFMIPNAGLYEFGIINSQMHMDWMRVVAGRFGNGYRYSAKLVYNNFPWPDISNKKPIEKLAQKILNAREVEFLKDDKTSLADLYDPDLMPVNLRKAHKSLDRAVDKLYSKDKFKTPLERVKHLLELYQQKSIEK